MKLKIIISLVTILMLPGTAGATIYNTFAKQKAHEDLVRRVAMTEERFENKLVYDKIQSYLNRIWALEDRFKDKEMSQEAIEEIRRLREEIKQLEKEMKE